MAGCQPAPQPNFQGSKYGRLPTCPTTKFSREQVGQVANLPYNLIFMGGKI